jgi:hypothetical protein
LDNHPITPGSLYVVTDTQTIYFDSAEGVRIEMGQMQALSESELDSILV